VNPFNGTRLARPIDTVVGQTKIPLHRSNFAHESLPAVIEGSSHDFLTDAFRQQAKADIGAIRGFRYGTHVAPGPIRMEDLYHFVAIGPLIARGTIRGQQVKNRSNAGGFVQPECADLTGGWLFNFSGVTMDFDPTSRGAGRQHQGPAPGQRRGAARRQGHVFYASYYFDRDPAINVVPLTSASSRTSRQCPRRRGGRVRYLQSACWTAGGSELIRS
jgi:hypothetical protein